MQVTTHFVFDYKWLCQPTKIGLVNAACQFHMKVMSIVILFVFEKVTILMLCSRTCLLLRHFRVCLFDSGDVLKSLYACVLARARVCVQLLVVKKFYSQILGLLNTVKLYLNSQGQSFNKAR